MKKLLFGVSLICLSLTAGFSQEEDQGLVYSDMIYLDNIKSVKFSIAGLPLSIPMINLNSSAQLMLSFDDLDGDVKDYTYTIVHCDINWQPSNLSDLEYIEGFTQDRIDQYQYSFKTINSYTHYELLLPNRNFSWTKSGNYLLKVYEDEGDKRLAVTRRFMVVDPKIRVEAKMVNPSQVSKSRTHQEMDFSVDYDKFPIRSPQQEIRAVVMKNGRWDNAIIDLAPNFTRLNSVVFDYQNKVVFPAGKEYRYTDLRSFRMGSETIAFVDEIDNNYEVALFPDTSWVNVPYFFRRDINGDFVIETEDQRSSELSANYAYILFSLKSEPFYDHQVYIRGELTDWQLKPDFEMIYNEAIKAYVAKPFLKQGYYDYEYVLAPRNRKRGEPVNADPSELQGNWYETENEYTILIYYRPFGDRYDQLIGNYTQSSVR